MIRNRLLASACQLLPLWQKGVAHPFHLMVATPHQHCGCALPLRLSIYCQRLRKENQSHQHDSKKIKKVFYIYIYSKKPPVEKIAQNWAWQGIAMPYHCRDGDWLTEAPVFQNGGGSGSWHKSTRDPNSPGVNHPHDNPPSPPYGRGRVTGRTKRLSPFL